LSDLSTPLIAELHPTTPYDHNWHLDLLQMLEAVRQGKIDD